MPEPSPEWYVRIKNNEFGPFTSVQLRQWAADGRITPSDLIRRGRSDWSPASSVKGLFPAESQRKPTGSDLNTFNPEPEREVPPPINEPPATPEYSWLNAITQPSTTSSKVRYQRKSDVPLDGVFDYGFRRYASIPIIKGLWILCIILAAITVVVAPCLLIYVAITSEYRDRVEQSQALYSTIMMSLIVVGATIIQLVVYRILFEFLIAIFNISESLKRLEEKST